MTPDPCCSGTYTCPMTEETECLTHGGFDICCSHPRCPGNTADEGPADVTRSRVGAGEDVKAVAEKLRSYATHFAARDWAYTRLHDIRHIRRAGDYSGYDHPVRRVHRAARALFTYGDLERQFGLVPWRHPLSTIKANLRTRRNTPDGVLNGAGITVTWEETGEYLQLVQPSVGALLADLMQAHPDLPEVQAIAAQMRRIQDGYADAIRAGNVDGRRQDPTVPGPGDAR